MTLHPPPVSTPYINGLEPAALAQHFGLPVYMVNLQEFNDAVLGSAMNSIPPRSMILFEDIDCMSGVQNRSSLPRTEVAAVPHSVTGATLSGLLNVLDGFSAPDSVIYVMTTNHQELTGPPLPTQCFLWRDA